MSIFLVIMNKYHGMYFSNLENLCMKYMEHDWGQGIILFWGLEKFSQASPYAELVLYFRSIHCQHFEYSSASRY